MPTTTSTKDTPVSKYQTFDMGRINRSAIIPHPQNPRVISAPARKKLRDKIEEVGLMQPLVINKRTGHLLSGHQRLTSLDALENYGSGKDYALDISFVDCDSKTELAMLAFFNNQSAQGGWDLDILAGLNLEMDIDFRSMGFDPLEIEMVFSGDERFAHQIHEDSEGVKKDKDTLAGIKERRERGKLQMAKKNESEFYFTIVCRDRDELETLLTNVLDLDANTLAISGDQLLASIEQLVTELVEDTLNPPTEGDAEGSVESVGVAEEEVPAATP